MKSRGIPGGHLLLYLLPLLAVTLSPEILDRIAVTVGDRVITELQIVREVRVAAFLNGEKPDTSSASRRAAAERLVKQELMRREMQSTHYPLPGQSEAEPLEKQIVDEYGGEDKYLAALQASGLTRDDIRQQLWWQLTTLRFIEYRFRPAVHIPRADIESYYQEEVDKWKAQGQTNIPTLEQSHDSIEQILTDERVDRALDSWLTEEQKRADVRYLEDAFQ